jgi:hypothetical protein
MTARLLVYTSRVAQDQALWSQSLPPAAHAEVSVDTVRRWTTITRRSNRSVRSTGCSRPRETCLGRARTINTLQNS